MEINVTNMVNDSDYMRYLSGSVAELGDRAKALTWENSQEYAKQSPLLQPDQLEEARQYFANMGFSDDARKWTDAEVQAAMIQDVAANIREMTDYEDEAAYQAAAENGQVSGRLFHADDGEWYFYVGCYWMSS